MSRPLYHRERNPVPTEQEDGWAQPVWTDLTKATSLAPAGIRTRDRPGGSLARDQQTCFEYYLLL
jgi:hypothetical protein